MSVTFVFVPDIRQMSSQIFHLMSVFHKTPMINEQLHVQKILYELPEENFIN